MWHSSLVTFTLAMLCHYAECHYAECHYADLVFYLNMLNDIVLIVVKLYVVVPLRVRFYKCVLPNVWHFKAKRSLNLFYP